MTCNCRWCNIDEICQLVRDMSAFLDEWEWTLPSNTDSDMNKLQARARALGLSDTRDAEDIERNLPTMSLGELLQRLGVNIE